MKVKDCVEYTIKCLAYMLDGGVDGKSTDMCRFYNKNNFNVGHFGILDFTIDNFKALFFYIEEKKIMNGDLGYFDDDDETESYMVPVSVYFIIRLLFEKEFGKLGSINHFVAQEGDNGCVTQYEVENNLSKFISLGISLDDMKGQLSSYSLINSLIDKIINGSGKGIVDTDSYNTLVNELNKIVVVNPNSIADEIKSIANLSYDDIVCLKNRNPKIINTLRAFDNLEVHLVSSLKHFFVEREIIFKGLDESCRDDLLRNVKRNDVLEMEIDGWMEFIYWVYFENSAALSYYNKLYNAEKPFLVKYHPECTSRGTPFGR